jgi:cell division protein FtsL
MILSIINAISLMVIISVSIYMVLTYIQIKSDMQKLAKIIPDTKEEIKATSLEVKKVDTLGSFDMNSSSSKAVGTNSQKSQTT